MSSVRIFHLYPELLNLYGDSGNMLVFKQRCAWRGIDCTIEEIHVGDTLQLSSADIVFIGGGSDREQKIVCETLQSYKQELASYVEDGGVLAAVCGGYQLLGHSYSMGTEELEGLSLVDLYTTRGSTRLIGNIAIESPIATHPIVGYENHGGRTYLGDSVQPLGKVISGFGNDDASGFEGCLYKHVVGTYIHGPLLPKNPEVADYLLQLSQDRKGEGALQALDDTEELDANSYMLTRMTKARR